MRWRLIPVREPSGAISELVAVGTDITTQELAKMSEAQMQLAVKASGVGMCVFVNDIGGQFLIRIGARDSFECVPATQIWGPCDNEKGNHLAFC
jgi:hypothetical protein